MTRAGIDKHMADRARKLSSVHDAGPHTTHVARFHHRW
jgi:hypothetical protein